MKADLSMEPSTVEKRSISAPSDLFLEADKRMAQLRMTNFSEYARWLIRQDLEGRLPVAPAGQNHEHAAEEVADERQ